MDVFIYIVPYLFRYLTEYIDTYRVELVQLIVSNVDPTHVLLPKPLSLLSA